MRSLLIGLFALSVLGLTVFLSAGPKDQQVKFRLQLLDKAKNKPISGMVRVLGTDKKPVPLPGLYDRFQGLAANTPGRGWYVVPEQGGDITLPAGPYTFEAVCGLETALGRQDLQVKADTKDVSLKLDFLFYPEATNQVAGNTHLHLRNMTLAESDEYLKKIPTADRLKVLFISYLERAAEDREYITNKYPIGDLKQFDVTGVLVNNGEEHRHNFKGYGQGFGHVMFLNIKTRFDPASIGPGIMAKGFDDQALRVGIDDARKQGGTVIWCHNTFGYEDVLNAMTGRLHALNVFDGSRKDKYEDSYYRFLNAGVKLPISTGTDWFMYDFSRVYAHVPGKLTVPVWLDAVKAGRCQATNGPLLQLEVNGRSVGETIDLKEPGIVQVKANGVGRHNFSKLELLHNGKVIHSQQAAPKDGHYRADLQKAVPIDEPGWFALRVETDNKNEFEQILYAHTSPVYVRLGGKDRFDVDAARDLVRMLEEGKAAIQADGLFSAPEARQRMLALYDTGIIDLTWRINQKKPA